MTLSRLAKFVQESAEKVTRALRSERKTAENFESLPEAENLLGVVAVPSALTRTLQVKRIIICRIRELKKHKGTLHSRVRACAKGNYFDGHGWLIRLVEYSLNLAPHRLLAAHQ